MTRRSVKNNAVHKSLGLLVASKRCNECLYSKNRLVEPEVADKILASCEQNGSYFICHKATIVNQNVVCRAFFDEQKNQVCQVAHRLGLVTFVDPGKRVDKNVGRQENESGEYRGERDGLVTRASLLRKIRRE